MAESILAPAVPFFNLHAQLHRMRRHQSVARQWLHAQLRGRQKPVWLRRGSTQLTAFRLQPMRAKVCPRQLWPLAHIIHVHIYTYIYIYCVYTYTYIHTYMCLMARGVLAPQERNGGGSGKGGRGSGDA